MAYMYRTPAVIPDTYKFTLSLWIKSLNFSAITGGQRTEYPIVMFGDDGTTPAVQSGPSYVNLTIVPATATYIQTRMFGRAVQVDDIQDTLAHDLTQNTIALPLTQFNNWCHLLVAYDCGPQTFAAGWPGEFSYNALGFDAAYNKCWIILNGTSVGNYSAPSNLMPLPRGVPGYVYGTPPAPPRTRVNGQAWLTIGSSAEWPVGSDGAIRVADGPLALLNTPTWYGYGSGGAFTQKFELGYVQMWFGRYVDPTVMSNFLKFVKIIKGKGYPEDPAKAAAAFGTQTVLFRGKASDGTFYVNRGNGGVFTKVGTINDYTPTPSYG